MADLQGFLFSALHEARAEQLQELGRHPGPDCLDGVLGTRARHLATPGNSLIEALALLPEQQRQVVLLIGVAGFGYERAARVLGITVETLMARLSRGRETLRAITASAAENAQALRAAGRAERVAVPLTH